MADWPYKATCVRKGCGHSSDVHTFDDAINEALGLGVGDDGAQFPCRATGCDCPTMQRSASNLEALERASTLASLSIRGQQWPT